MMHPDWLQTIQESARLFLMFEHDGRSNVVNTYLQRLKRGRLMLRYIEGTQ